MSERTLNEILAAKDHVDRALVEFMAGNKRRSMEQIGRAEAILLGLKHALKSQLSKRAKEGT